MIFHLLMIGLFTLGRSQQSNDEYEEDIKNILRKYIQNVKDIDSKYVINEPLSKSISHYLNGKVNVLPLYRISLKIDRNPVKIPWTINEQPTRNASSSQMKYKYVAVKDNTN